MNAAASNIRAHAQAVQGFTAVHGSSRKSWCSSIALLQQKLMPVLMLTLTRL